MKPTSLPSKTLPSKQTHAFNAALVAVIETVAQRLSQTNKTFHYGSDVARALIEASDTYPSSKRQPGDPLPFVRRLPKGIPPVPSAPWALSIPLHYAARLPETDLRAFVNDAFVRKAARLGLDGSPNKSLPPPLTLPCRELSMTTRHLEEVLVGILTALPVVAPSHDERVGTTLRWLRSALLVRN